MIATCQPDCRQFKENLWTKILVPSGNLTNESKSRYSAACISRACLTEESVLSGTTFDPREWEMWKFLPVRVHDYDWHVYLVTGTLYIWKGNWCMERFHLYRLNCTANSRSAIRSTDLDYLFVRRHLWATNCSYPETARSTLFLDLFWPFWYVVSETTSVSAGLVTLKHHFFLEKFPHHRRSAFAQFAAPQDVLTRSSQIRKDLSTSAKCH